MKNLFGEDIEFQELKTNNKEKKVAMNKFVKYYFRNQELTIDEKKLLLKVYKKRNIVKCKTFDYNKNYLSVKKYAYPLSVPNKLNDFDKEFLKVLNDLEVGSCWWNSLDISIQKKLNEDFKKKYEFDTSIEIANNKLRNEVIDSKIEDKVEYYYDYAIEHNDSYLFDFEINDLKIDTLNKISLGVKPFNPFRLIDKLIIFAYKENRFDLLDLNDKDEVILSEESYQKYIVNGERFPYSKKEIVKQSLNRTIKTFLELVRCNCEKFVNFITLTFANKEDEVKHKKLNSKKEIFDFIYVDDTTSYELCSDKFSNFVDNLKKKMKKINLDFYYLGVAEYQKNGSIHYHLLTSYIPDELIYNIPTWLDFDYYKNELKNGKGITLWKYGKSDIQVIEDKARITTYVMKYMVKSFDNIIETEFQDRLNKKRFYHSKNLVKGKSNNYDDYIDIKVNDYYSKYEKECGFGDGNYCSETLYQTKKLDYNHIKKNYDYYEYEF